MTLMDQGGSAPLDNIIKATGVTLFEDGSLMVTTDATDSTGPHPTYNSTTWASVLIDRIRRPS
jgi:hypothetical protein